MTSVLILAGGGVFWNTGVRGGGGRGALLSRDAAVVRVQVGDALVIAPCDDGFSAVSQRLEARMHGSGRGVEDLIAAAAEAREQIVREGFGVGDDE